MSTMTNILEMQEMRKHGYDENLDRYIVVHPLDDMPEEKIDTENLGPMAMTATVKWSLLSLRAYLVLMILLVLYRVIQLAVAPGGIH